VQAQHTVSRTEGQELKGYAPNELVSLDHNGDRKRRRVSRRTRLVWARLLRKISGNGILTPAMRLMAMRAPARAPADLLIKMKARHRCCIARRPLQTCFGYSPLDFDLGGSIDIGSSTRMEGEPHAPVGRVTQFFYRAANRGEQFRSDYQKFYDEGIQIALKYLGE
jgi:hypothetical protein